MAYVPSSSTPGCALDSPHCACRNSPWDEPWIEPPLASIMGKGLPLSAASIESRFARPPCLPACSEVAPSPVSMWGTSLKRT